MFNGIFPVLPTLFDDKNGLDLKAQEKAIRFALASNAHGLVFPGVASESSYLSQEEREKLIRQLVGEVDSRIPIIGGASANEASLAIDLGTSIQRHGIQTVMIMAPAILGSRVDAHLAFFQEISNALPGMEIMLQNAPNPVGAGLTAKALLEIVKKVPAIKYVKEETLPSGPSVSHLQAHAPPSLLGVFGGGGARYIIDELNRGALGAMPALEIADLHVAIYHAHSKGKKTLARQLYSQSLPLLATQAIYRMRLTKRVLNQRGIANSCHVRAPLPELDHLSESNIDLMLNDLHESVLAEGHFPWIEMAS